MFDYIDYSKTFVDNIQYLASPYLIGDFNCCEVTEIFGFNKQSRAPVNIYSLVTFEKSEERHIRPQHITQKPINVKGLRDWSFGIQCSRITPDILFTALANLFNHQMWNIIGSPLETGNLTALPQKFVPAESDSIPVNALLKNNFWNGSYIYELFAQEKCHLRPFLDTPSLLQELSSHIEKYRPINLAINSDRLGSIIVQLPIKCVSWEIEMCWNNSIKVSLDWSDPKFKRPCQLAVISEYDSIVNDAGSYDANGHDIVIPGNFDGIEKLILWDKVNKIILGSLSSYYYIKELNLGLHPLSPEPRTVTITELNGLKTSFHVGLSHPMPSIISRREPSDITWWTRRRTYKEKIDTVNRTLEFVQYFHGDREKALADIRTLINKYGFNKICLWDPYLDARDIMHTLYHCSSTSTRLYALGSYNRSTASIHKKASQNPDLQYFDWKQAQIALFTDTGNNNLGLNFEFRVARGVDNGSFHDRFLIFPETDDGPKAWSLGISINALGDSHHILQSTSNPQMVVDAFFRFWDSIADTNNQIWSTHGPASK